MEPTLGTIQERGAGTLEKREGEEAIRRNEERLKRTEEIAHLGSWELDLARNELTWSDEVYRIFGLEPQEFGATYEAFLERVHPADRAQVHAAYTGSVMHRNASYELEHRVVRKDTGEVRWVHEKCEHIHDEMGEIVRSVGMVLDVTERRKTEEALKEAKAAAEAASVAKDQFIAVLSHELRTPLTPALAAVAALAEDQRLPASVREDMEMVRRNIGLEVRIIDDLLDLSRISTGKLRLEKKSISVHEALKNTVEICRSEAATRAVTMDVDLSAVEDHVHADTARLQQVFWNLLKNAIKFSRAGGMVRCRTMNPTAQRIAVEVEDNGVGIPPEMQERIFDAFEQGQAGVTRHFGGLGLGLAISRAIVELHEGTIAARSDGRGHGATFRVEFPTFASKEAAGTPVQPATESDALDGLRLLLVEDHADSAKILARLLRTMGVKVTVAGTVAAAMQSMEGETFDIIVSDLGLPDGNGHDMMRAIRDRWTTPGIAMSGYGMQSDVVESREAGFAVHLVKPVDVDRLSEAIAVVARGGRDRVRG